MMKIFTRCLPISLGVIASILSVLFMAESVQLMDLSLDYISESLDNWAEFLPYLVLGIVMGLIGIPTFIYGLSKLQTEP